MKFLLSCFLLISTYASGQTIVNLVMIDSKNKITDNAKNAEYFIVVKKHSDSSFERIEYKYTGPRLRSFFYKDSELKIKNGVYRSYNDTGRVQISGKYINNKKAGTWYNSLTEIYQEFKDDVMISEKTKAEYDLPKDTTKHKIEIESAYPGGPSSYMRFLNKNFRYPDRALKMRVEGTVLFDFMVNKEGKVEQPSIVRSVEFSIDEEVLRLASLMPNWVPANQDGKLVNSYKRQPITFSIP